MGEKNSEIMANIQGTLRSMDLKKPTLSTLAQKGDDEVCSFYFYQLVD